MSKLRRSSRDKIVKNRKPYLSVAIIILIAAAALPGYSQSNPGLQTFFRENIGLSQDQVAAIRNGHPVTKALPSRVPAEVFLFGAVYIHTAPEKYLQFAGDFERMRKLPNYLALGVFSNPPQLSDLNGFSFDDEDIKALKSCKPGDCMLQMPASSIDELNRLINLSAPDVNAQVNQYLQKTALQLVLAYRREGNQALGVYNDRSDPRVVSEKFAYMLSYPKVLPERVTDFYQYLLSYPKAKPANVEETVYWARVKFGLKPTLRVVQLLTMRGDPAHELAYAFAEKQLYSSHYFQTALDLTFCVRDSDEPNPSGFYLIMVMGSEQAGLNGAKGSLIRNIAVGRSVSTLRDALMSIKSTLETGQ